MLEEEAGEKSDELLDGQEVEYTADGVVEEREFFRAGALDDDCRVEKGDLEKMKNSL